MDGDIVATDGNQFWSGSLTSPIILDKNGSDQTNQLAWTGSNEVGQGQANTCGDDWNNSSEVGSTGLAGAVDADWIDYGTADCNTQARLYCVSQ